MHFLKNSRLGSLRFLPFAFLADFFAVTLPGLSTVAFSGLIGDSSTHSKTSIVWNSEDIFPPPLFQNLLGFSSLF